jgi:hypothetical protein
MFDNARLIAGLILEHPLCVDCVALRVEMTAAGVEGNLAVMGRLIRVHREHDRCRACGITTWVVSTLSESPDH